MDISVTLRRQTDILDRVQPLASAPVHVLHVFCIFYSYASMMIRWEYILVFRLYSSGIMCLTVSILSVLSAVQDEV